MVQDLHNDVTALKHSNTPNFIDIASSKVKYMGLDDEGSLQLKASTKKYNGGYCYGN
jgi:hypothetical protein